MLGEHEKLQTRRYAQLEATRPTLNALTGEVHERSVDHSLSSPTQPG
jgi:hypothetical protein